MEFQEFLNLIGKRKKTILAIVFVTLVLTIAVSLISPLKYGAKSRLLVLQDSNGADAYSLSKSNEYLGNLFTQVVGSGSFYDQVRASQYNIDRNYFAGSYSDQLKKWNQTVQADTQSDTGIIEINVYHPNIQEAKQISLAVNDILINQNQAYHSGQNIKVSIIDQPLVSNYPVKPNLPYNGAVALVASFIISLFYIYIFPEHKKKTPAPRKEVRIPVKEIVYEAQREYNPIEENYNNQPETERNIYGNINNVLRK
jgi:capsular polysaccharide biosynthesis protein